MRSGHPADEAADTASVCWTRASCRGGGGTGLWLLQKLGGILQVRRLIFQNSDFVFFD